MDPKDLNQAIKQEHYPLLTVEEVVSHMPNAKYFSVLGTDQGFWQIKLDDDSSNLQHPHRTIQIPALAIWISSAPEVF